MKDLVYSKQVLVVLSGTSQVRLRGGRDYSSGYFLPELGLPLKGLLEEGWRVTIATPEGKRPLADPELDQSEWFYSASEHQQVRSLVESTLNSEAPVPIREALNQLARYKGLLVAGGLGPLFDLFCDSNLGLVLQNFHIEQKPIALSCFSTLALLSTMTLDAQSKEVVTTLIENLKDLESIRMSQNPFDGWTEIQKAVTNLNFQWPFSGYKMAVSSRDEEKPNPYTGEKAGKLPFCASYALALAGARVHTEKGFRVNVVRDRELITGQNPMSARDLSLVFLDALSERRPQKTPRLPDKEL